MKTNGKFSSFINLLYYMFTPYKKADGIFGIISNIISFLTFSGVIASPIAVKLSIVPDNIPKWVFLFVIPMSILLCLSIIAGTCKR